MKLSKGLYTKNRCIQPEGFLDLGELQSNKKKQATISNPTESFRSS